MKTMQLMIRDDGSGDPWAHCGEYGSSDTMKAIVNFIQGFDDDDEREITIKFVKMTPEEIEALPEM